MRHGHLRLPARDGKSSLAQASIWSSRWRRRRGFRSGGRRGWSRWRGGRSRPRRLRGRPRGERPALPTLAVRREQHGAGRSDDPAGGRGWRRAGLQVDGHAGALLVPRRPGVSDRERRPPAPKSTARSRRVPTPSSDRLRGSGHPCAWRRLARRGRLRQPPASGPHRRPRARWAPAAQRPVAPRRVEELPPERPAACASPPMPRGRHTRRRVQRASCHAPADRWCGSRPVARHLRGRRLFGSALRAPESGGRRAAFLRNRRRLFAGRLNGGSRQFGGRRRRLGHPGISLAGTTSPSGAISGREVKNTAATVAAALMGTSHLSRGRVTQVNHAVVVASAGAAASSAGSSCDRMASASWHRPQLTMCASRDDCSVAVRPPSTKAARTPASGHSTAVSRGAGFSTARSSRSVSASRF